MDSLVVIILIALTVAALGYAITQFLSQLLRSDRRKINKRLVSEYGDPLASQRRSILIQMEASGISGSLARNPIFQKLYRNLIQAFPNITLTQFLGTSAILGIVSFLLGTVIFDSLIFGLAAGAGGAYLPFMILGNRRAKRQRTITQQLPEALDFLGRVLRAGHSLSTGFQMISEEMPQPLASEFRRCYDQHSLGQPLEDCLKDMAARIESTDFAFFVTTVLIQRQTGGDLSEVLSNISGMIRQRVRLAMAVKSKTAEGRFTGYILVAFPAGMFVLIYFLNPAQAGIMLHSSTGLTMLSIAVTLQILGLFAIRKITTIRV
ncbi:MAG TPA: type II secretion system F family protein [Tepidisphaeraceae bacterium]|jgi:tight adherence protein B|nr:type II secretion system F family protein [Tepidisphaeraceae bacterium]